MSHDWGVTVPPDLPTETLIEVRHGIRAGTISVELPARVKDHPKCAEWEREMREQMLAAYDREIAKRLS